MYISSTIVLFLYLLLGVVCTESDLGHLHLEAICPFSSTLGKQSTIEKLKTGWLLNSSNEMCTFHLSLRLSPTEHVHQQKNKIEIICTLYAEDAFS